MASASIIKKITLNADGILSISGDGIGIEDVNTGEYIDFRTLLSDFADRSIKLSVNYSEDYE